MELKKYLWESNEAERYLLLLAHNNGKYLLKLLIFFSPQRRKVRAVKSLTLNQIIKKNTKICGKSRFVGGMGERKFCEEKFSFVWDSWESRASGHISRPVHMTNGKKSTNFLLCGSFIIILQSDVKLSLSSVYKFQFTFVGFTGSAR